ncbi:MAG: hypothetical protein ABSH41_22330 [Syntrophobacteraceae bacterium]
MSKKKSGQPLPVSCPDNSLSGRTGASLDHGYAADVLSSHDVYNKQKIGIR